MAGISYCILEVDLSARKTQVVKYGDVVLRKYFGGSGLAASILLDRFDPSGDAFHPDNPLIFMTGLFTGIPVPCGCRVSVCAKSPLGHWGEANAGGDRSEEHTSELQSRLHLVCRLLLYKKWQAYGKSSCGSSRSTCATSSYRSCCF